MNDSCSSSNFPSKSVAIFGGTGELGRESVFQALKAGYKVYSFSKTPSKMLIPPGSGGENAGKPFDDPNLIIFQGDVTIPSVVNSFFESIPKIESLTGVIVSLGGRTKIVGPTMLTVGTSNIIDGMKNYFPKTRRITCVTSIGVGDSINQAPWTFRILIYTVMRSIFKDKFNQEQLFLSPQGPGHDLEFSIIRPGGLGNGPPTGVVNVIDGAAGSIHRSDVASFLLRALSEETFPYLLRPSSISSTLGTGWVKQPEIPGFDTVNKV